MRPTALLAAVLLAACSPAVVSASLDAATDAPRDAAVAADTPAAVDTPAPMDVPAAVDVPPARDVPAMPPPDGSLLPPRDGGPLPIDGGALGEPPWVALDVRTNSTCPPLTACGGAEGGTWDVGGGCIEVTIPSELAACPGARVSRAEGRARGRVTYAGGFARRASQWEIESEVFVPSLCAGFVGGCPGLQSLVRMSFPDSVCVTEGGGNCRCAARQAGLIDDADRYTVSNMQFVSSASGKRWSYCISGDQLRYRDDSPSGPREIGIITLTRRAP